MLKYWIFLTCYCLSFFGFVQAFDQPYDQRNGPSNFDPTAIERELDATQQKINALKSQLHKLQLVEMREEVKGQGLSIGDWQGYSKEFQTIRQQYGKQRELLDQLEKLELHQAELIEKLRYDNAY